MSDQSRTSASPARLGLTGPRSEEHLRATGWWSDGRPAEGAEPVLLALSRSPDPDLALRGVDRVREALGDGWSELSTALRTDHVLRGRLLAVLGSSTALSDFLAANARRWQLLAGTESVDVDRFAPTLVDA